MARHLMRRRLARLEAQQPAYPDASRESIDAWERSLSEADDEMTRDLLRAILREETNGTKDSTAARQAWNTWLDAHGGPEALHA